MWNELWKHIICCLRFICHCLMTSAFNNEKFHIFLSLKTSLKSNMLLSNLPCFLHTIRLQSHSLQIFYCVWKWNNIIPISRKKVNFKTVDTYQRLKLLDTAHFIDIIKFINCWIADVKFAYLWIECFVIYWEVIINWLVIETLWKLCPCPGPIIIHF